MTTATITKTIAKVNDQPSEYSTGFKRLTSLPLRVRNNIILACVVNGENNTNSMKDFLNNLTEQEFINWVKISIIANKSKQLSSRGLIASFFCFINYTYICLMNDKDSPDGWGGC